MRTLEQALKLAHRVPVFPCNDKKEPICKGGFKSAVQEPTAVRALWHRCPGQLIGVPTGPVSGFDVLDIDPKHGGHLWLEKNLESLPITRTHQTRSGGSHFLMRHQSGVRNSESKIAPGVDTRGLGGYIIWWPSAGCHVENPQTLGDWPLWLLRVLIPSAPSNVVQLSVVSTTSENDQTAATRLMARALANLRTASPGRRHYALRGAACLFGGMLDAEGLSESDVKTRLLNAVQGAGGDAVNRDNATATIESGLKWGRNHPLRAGGAPVSANARPTSTSLEMADKVARLAALSPIAYDQCREAEAASLGIRVGTLDQEVQTIRPKVRGAFRANDTTPALPPRFSDDGIALRFSERHDGRLVYVAAWPAWMRWDGVRWAKDDTLSVFDRARVVCRDTALDAESEKDGAAIANAVTSSGTISSVERLARSDPRHARRSDDFDADPWTLNTPSGVVDLRTGALRPHRRSDLVTKVTGTAPAGRCKRWIQFLLEITQGDRALVRYLQRFIGYSLTGLVDEHAFVFLYGPGGNGKSVLLSTIAAVLGDYATTAMADVFTMSRSEQHPTHLAHLRGARMVVVTETEEGRPWAESRIKALTGGDRISARVMRGDPFEFSPAFKLWIAGNHRPALRNPDPAMRRRLHMVPLTFVPVKPDTGLTEALRAELPGILAWAIRGCLSWQEHGLKAPAVVRGATDAYFAEQDSLREWVAERCDRDGRERHEVSSRHLFADWKRWMTARGEDFGTEKRFSAEMERMFVKKVTKTGRKFVGLELRLSEPGESAPGWAG